MLYTFDKEYKLLKKQTTRQNDKNRSKLILKDHFLIQMVKKLSEGILLVCVNIINIFDWKGWSLSQKAASMPHVIQKIWLASQRSFSHFSRSQKIAWTENHSVFFELFSILTITLSFHAFHFLFQIHCTKIIDQKTTLDQYSSPSRKKQRPNTIPIPWIVKTKITTTYFRSAYS